MDLEGFEPSSTCLQDRRLSRFGFRPMVSSRWAPAGGFEPPTFSLTGSCPSLWASPDRVPIQGIEPHQPFGARFTAWPTSQCPDRVGTTGRTRTLKPGLEDLLPIQFGVGGMVRVGGLEPPTPGFEDRRSDFR